MNFAIIGAGMAGLSCADVLKAAGHTVALYDKGRGPGGRMSTRRIQTSLGEVSFDHGAQYFTVRDPDFRQLTETWKDAGVAAPWLVVAPDAWVGLPGMNAVISHMGGLHDVSWGQLVSAVERCSADWWLTSSSGKFGPFDAVIVAVPAEQAAPILSLHDFAMARLALLSRSQPCWTGMFVFDRPLGSLPQVIRQRGNIAWAARNSMKPGRSGPEAWVVQASGTWSNEHLEHLQDEIAVLLHGELQEAAGCEIPLPIAAVAHRWRFALSSGTGDGAMWNPVMGLGACGDWLLGPRIECAWLSGRMLGAKILQQETLSSSRACPKVHVQKTPIPL
jgi:renalase